ncbi:MAG: CsbD family protein [Planctomycetota bacterium]
MINQQTLQGNWHEIKGLLRRKWGALTDDDVMVFNGNVEQLLGTIQRKTGEARESVEQFFEQFKSNGAAAINQAGETVRAGAQQAADYVQDTAQHAADSVRDGYADVEELVRQRPAESLAVCFGAGVITGVIVSLLLWRR